MWFTDRFAGAAVAFTDATEGNLAAHTGADPAQVAAHRRALEVGLGLAAGSLRYMHQVHGTDVVTFASNGGASRSTPLEAPVADAAISEDGTPLVVLTADCLPVIFVAERPGADTPLLAVAHAGRRGLLDGVLQNTVGALRARGATTLTAWIGPAICGACYEVPEDMRAESARMLPGIDTETSWHSPGLDLPGTARRVLEGLRVRVADPGSARSDWCTLEHTQLYSYRRDKTTSRHAGIVWVPPAFEPAGKDTP